MLWIGVIIKESNYHYRIIFLQTSGILQIRMWIWNFYSSKNRPDVTIKYYYVMRLLGNFQWRTQTLFTPACGLNAYLWVWQLFVVVKADVLRICGHNTHRLRLNHIYIHLMSKPAVVFLGCIICRNSKIISEHIVRLHYIQRIVHTIRSVPCCVFVLHLQILPISFEMTWLGAANETTLKMWR